MGVKEIDSAIGSFIEMEPYRVVPVVDDDHAATHVSFSFNYRINHPPELSLIFGEVIHHLRCALNWLACQLIVAESGRVRGKRGFPVFSPSANSTEEDILRFVKKGMKGGSSEAIDIVKDMQPRYRSDGEHSTHPLTIINEFNRIDKHMLLTKIGAVPRVTSNLTGEDLVFKDILNDGYRIHIPKRINGKPIAKCHDDVIVKGQIAFFLEGKTIRSEGIEFPFMALRQHVLDDAPVCP